MLFEDFLACKGQWKEGSIMKSIKNSHSNSKRGVRKWLTARQLLQHFDQETVDQIVLRKESDAELKRLETRSHPEVPGETPC